ncbi:lipopolysaccharide heptosyltransferase II [Hydrogenimonas cancrithermarum]|uniref:lipopolysaccharide heptosyltransferase II n=1 Tax=Hydrogenimonas cancrithermarum TaxID=2993563 RepID=A0ABM8FP49_9BACT|nr:lipopolysaccharide heptosyltransferase II [Hydrogenimonas cancrithermarum]BDY13440.1 heptosyltransferase II [Hydrogenimonas cancrithermarum]
MKLLIELPTWLGDAVMTTPALENLFAAYPDAEVTLLGSYVSTEALKAHPRVDSVIVDKTKADGFRPLNVYRLAKTIGPHDIAVSFRSHLYSKALLYLTGTPKRYVYDKNLLTLSPSHPLTTTHQVEKYQAFIDIVTGRNDTPGPLRLDWPIKRFERPAMGINPGATYGSAKRWYPEKFAEVAAALAGRFDIVIFGGPAETDIAGDIEKMVREKGIKNVTNLAGKTTIPELCSTIAGLDLFITGDSGPMHVAAAYQIPTVAIFGPTKHKETCQWMNPESVIVRHDLECAPCMKRTCPIKTHECMKGISAQEVIDAAHGIIGEKNGA